MQIIAPGDIAVYGTLCALASYTRGAIKAQILQNSVFGVYIEQEPYVRELIEAHMSSNFKGVLGLLSRYYVRDTRPTRYLHPADYPLCPSSLGIHLTSTSRVI